MHPERTRRRAARRGGQGFVSVAFLIGVNVGFERGRSNVRFGPNPLGSILPPSEREAPIGQAPPLFLAQAPQTSVQNPSDELPRPVTLRRRMLGLIAVVGIVAAACQSTGPSPAPSESAAVPSPSVTAPSTPPSSDPSAPASPADLSKTYAEIEQEVLAIRGLEAKQAVDPVVLDDAGIKRVTSEGFEKDNPEELVDANERLLKGLGLLAAGRRPGRPLRRAARRAGRGPLQPGRQGALRRVPQRRSSVRPRRRPSPTSTPTRCRTRTSTSRRSSSTRSARATGRSAAWRSSRATRPS